MDSKYSLEEIDNIAAVFLQEIAPHKVIAFHGEMGAGKTTFINALCRQLGVTDSVSSPTFSIINQYKTGQSDSIYHLDLYRIKNDEEAVMAGVEDCFYSGSLCFAEWPEKAPALFPDDTLHCYLTSSGDNERKLQIKL
jgi:tRNA threonylcarbamoyladenosine biosynthesis protein TsaE